MMKIIDIASCMIFPALYSTSQVCSVIFSSVAPRTKLYAPYNYKKYGWVCLRRSDNRAYSLRLRLNRSVPHMLTTVRGVKTGFKLCTGMSGFIMLRST